MSGQIGIIYSTVDGQSLKISKVLANHLHDKHQKVILFPIEEFNEGIHQFDVLVVGASVRYGKHSDLVQRFIVENKTELNRVRTAFFSVNLVARKPERSTPETNPYFTKLIETVDWKPNLAAVFAGKLHYARYSFRDRFLIKFIMMLTNGPIRTRTPIEYTDWEKVKLFSDKILELQQVAVEQNEQANRL